ncbi:hypothetical protein [Chitinophaga sp. 22620]|uniref:hypothetical protein n=1 Tax=Chitinophaga sp. 22620 TaxID=3453952 RepID=UPI003F87596D
MRVKRRHCALKDVIARSSEGFVQGRDEAISFQVLEYFNSVREIASSPHPLWRCCFSQ